MHFGRIYLSVFLLSAALAGALAGCSSQNSSRLDGVPNGSLVYCKPSPDDSSQTDVFVIGTDGSNKRQIAHLASTASNPMWSPDGSSLAYQTGSSGYASIGVTDSDGRNQQVVTGTHEKAKAPIWSSDGQQIAYYSWDSNPGYAIHATLVCDKTDRIINSGESERSYPYWSPNGKTVVFHMQESKDIWDIGVVNADGTGFKKLTSNAGMNCLPTYSSDGSKIAFWSTRTGEWELYVMDAQGHGVTALTKKSGLGNLPSGITRAVWSPEGNYIAYSPTDSSGNKSLIVMDLDGHQAKIADNVGDLTEWRSAEFQSGATDIVNIKATP